jgi:hypothetical protein
VIYAQETVLNNFIDEFWSDGNVEVFGGIPAAVYTINLKSGDPSERQTLTIYGFKDRLVKSRAATPNPVFSVNDILESWRKHHDSKRPYSALGSRPPAPESIFP